MFLYLLVACWYLNEQDVLYILFSLQKLESLLLDGDNLASPSSTLSLVSDASSGLKHRRSSSKLKDENSPVGFGAELSQVSLGYLSCIFLHQISFTRSFIYSSSQN